MGWKVIVWPKPSMGLLQEGSACLNAKLCDQSTPQISTYHPKARPICTLSMNAPKLWCNKTTRNPLGYFTANPIGTKAHDPTNYWNIPILCPCCVMHYSTNPQHNSIATIKSN